MLLNLIFLVNLCANCQTKNLKTKEIVKTEFGNILDSLKVKGSKSKVKLSFSFLFVFKLVFNDFVCAKHLVI